MALSKVWTAEKFWSHAQGDMANLNPVHYAQRFEKINLVQNAVATEFYPLMASAYRTPAVIVTDDAGIYGSGTWVASSATLTLGVRNTDFLSTDLGKMVAYRVGASFYLGVIASVVSTSAVVLAGSSIRATNGTVDEAMMIATVPSGDYIELSTLSPHMMRVGQQVDLELHSTSTSSVHPVTPEELRVFQPDSPLNANRIVFALEGERVLLDKGHLVTSYGTLTLKYPHVPRDVARGSDFLDLPDGAPITLGMTLLRRMIGPPEWGPALVQDAARNVKAVFDAFGAKASLEEIQEKVKNLS